MVRTVDSASVAQESRGFAEFEAMFFRGRQILDAIIHLMPPTRSRSWGTTSE